LTAKHYEKQLIEKAKETKTSIVYALGLNTTRAENGPDCERLAEVLDSVGFDAHFPDPEWRVLDPHHWARNMANYAAGLIERNKEQ